MAGPDKKKLQKESQSNFAAAAAAIKKAKQTLEQRADSNGKLSKERKKLIDFIQKNKGKGKTKQIQAQAKKFRALEKSERKKSERLAKQMQSEAAASAKALAGFAKKNRKALKSGRAMEKVAQQLTQVSRSLRG